MRKIGYKENFISTNSNLTVPLPNVVSAEDKRKVLYNTKLRNGLADYPHYSIMMNKETKQAFFSAANIDQNKLHTGLKGSWFIDKRIGVKYQLPPKSYDNNPWDKGHLTRRAAIAWGNTRDEAKEASRKSYSYANACFQHQNFNRDEWRVPEDAILKLKKDHNNKLCVMTGPIFTADSRYYKYKPSANRTVYIGIPSGFWKLVAYQKKGTRKLETLAFIMYQDDQAIAKRNQRKDLLLKNYQVSTTLIAKVTGLKFEDVLYNANPLYANERIRISHEGEVVFDAHSVPGPGSLVRIWKQDPTIHRLGAQTLFLPGQVSSGPKDSSINMIAPIVKQNPHGNFLLDPDQDQEKFDVVHTFAVVRRVLTMFERALSRAGQTPAPVWSWAWGNTPLKTTPYAGNDANAYYSRNETALKFYFFHSHCYLLLDPNQYYQDEVDTLLQKYELLVLYLKYDGVNQWLLLDNKGAVSEVSKIPTLKHLYQTHLKGKNNQDLFRDPEKQRLVLKGIAAYHTGQEEKLIYTCQSYDVVAHEAGHAILDSLKPNWNISQHPETGGLHEAFGDLTAIFSLLMQTDVCDAVINATKGDLYQKSFFSILAEQFGQALGLKFGLRNANQDKKLSQVSTEEHAISEVFTGAIYDILASMFNDAKKPEKYSYQETLLYVGQYLLGLLLQAIEKAPDKDATFADVASKMIALEKNNAWKNIIRTQFTQREVLGAHAYTRPSTDLISRFNLAGCCGTIHAMYSKPSSKPKKPLQLPLSTKSEALIQQGIFAASHKEGKGKRKLSDINEEKSEVRSTRSKKQF